MTDLPERLRDRIKKIILDSETRDFFYQAADELELLRAANDGLQHSFDASQQLLSELRAENERLGRHIEIVESELGDSMAENERLKGIAGERFLESIQGPNPWRSIDDPPEDETQTVMAWAIDSFIMIAVERFCDLKKLAGYRLFKFWQPYVPPKETN